MGFLALILHAHLPFVRHPEHEHFLEEDWFFEAVTETYIPLLRMMHRLVDDSVPFKLTMSLTPTLCAMLQDQLLRERYLRHLDNLIDLAAREQQRNRKHPQLRELADFYFNLFSETRRVFIDEWKGDLLSIFRELRETGAIEIIASGRYPLQSMTTHLLGLRDVDLALRTIGGEGLDDAIHMSIDPWQ